MRSKINVIFDPLGNVARQVICPNIHHTFLVIYTIVHLSANVPQLCFTNFCFKINMR